MCPYKIFDFLVFASTTAASPVAAAPPFPMLHLDDHLLLFFVLLSSIVAAIPLTPSPLLENPLRLLASWDRLLLRLFGIFRKTTVLYRDGLGCESVSRGIDAAVGGGDFEPHRHGEDHSRTSSLGSDGIERKKIIWRRGKCGWRAGGVRWPRTATAVATVERFSSSSSFLWFLWCGIILFVDIAQRSWSRQILSNFSMSKSRPSLSLFNPSLDFFIFFYENIQNSQRCTQRWFKWTRTQPNTTLI